MRRRNVRAAGAALAVRTGLAVIAGLAGLAGCARASASVPGPPIGQPIGPAVGVGTSVHAITVGGLTRSYRVYRPASLPAAAPLVVMLHGGFGSAEQAERYYGWDREADAGHFVVAYPDGLSRAWNAGGGCCGRPAANGVDDVAFITQMVAAIGREIRLDPRRLYATGISNGGMMAYRLACDTRLFAAIGPDSATLLAACPSPAPVSVIHIHGTADRRIPYNGGQGTGSAHIDGPAIPSVTAFWQRVDQCARPSVSVHAPVTVSVAACPDGRGVELITIAGAGHQWPGSPSRPAIQRLLGLDPPSGALNATTVIWQFFQRHPAIASARLPASRPGCGSGHRSVAGSRTGFTSMTGVLSRASSGRTRIRSSWIARIRTRCRPTGLGRSGDRVLKTPVGGRAGSSRGRVTSTPRSARSSQVSTMTSAPGARSRRPSATSGSKTSHAAGAPSSPCRGACARSVSGDSTHPIGTTRKSVIAGIASAAERSGWADG